MSVRLLVLDDDDGIRTSLSMALEDEGYTVVAHASAEDALQEPSLADVDVFLVDLMLGGMDGFGFVREIRRRSDVPIIVISAKADTHDIVAALEAGADDYVTKPFEIKEVGARLRALRRRPPMATPAPASPSGGVVVLDAAHGPLVLDTLAGRVRRGDDEVHVTVTEYHLLRELAESAGRVLSRQVLLDRVWDRGYFGDERIVDVHVRRLRTKIEADPSEPTLLVTVRGLGYRLDPR
ncbi:response regulator transcription factor [Phycicoccus sp. MAQZ13P-2]|uniref:response regulator transcription factor n=1 Tax=Phycicoccus mangrovi TaxID=2840470 RepID=UPI001BFFF01C|nr:response regulator transcription factor [Phycicoccus mangrovi]MBT9257492.1 response regulator transcription factor [Phycicoccus mangrovi]MBT9275839.1 response regulator transcription factor [Phycicoccus mangrovi]